MFGHVDAPCVFYVFLWFMYMDANVDALQYFWVFIYFDEMLCRMEVLHGVIDMPI